MSKSNETVRWVVWRDDVNCGAAEFLMKKDGRETGWTASIWKADLIEFEHVAALRANDVGASTARVGFNIDYTVKADAKP